ncbi:MAG: putative cytokinetic ring protein SteA [Actinomycetota bacterium]
MAALRLFRRPSADEVLLAGRVGGRARVDRRTKDLIRRVHPGNVAVIDHEDLDLLAAESLIEHGVVGVVNAGRSITGRYPNIGPLMLVRAGIPLIDSVGEQVLDEIAEGDLIEIDGDKVIRDGEVVASGTLLGSDEITRMMHDARADLSATVEQFAENTLEFVRREQSLLLESVHLPELSTNFRGRHALVVVRGYHYKQDLQALRAYVREMKPVIVAVDGAADACLDEGITPDVIVGDVDSVSVEAIQCGAEIVVHPQGEWRRRFDRGEADDDPPEVLAVRALGIEPKIVTAPGMSEDMALLLAHEKGAELVVAVGTHNSAMEMLDKGRRGMASTFLVRMRIGPALVDAKGVSQLYRTRVRTGDLWLLIAAAMVCFGVITAVAPPMKLFWLGLWDQIQQILPFLD